MKLLASWRMIYSKTYSPPALSPPSHAIDETSTTRIKQSVTISPPALSRSSHEINETVTVQMIHPRTNTSASKVTT